MLWGTNAGMQNLLIKLYKQVTCMRNNIHMSENLHLLHVCDSLLLSVISCINVMYINICVCMHTYGMLMYISTFLNSNLYWHLTLNQVHSARRQKPVKVNVRVVVHVCVIGKQDVWKWGGARVMWGPPASCNDSGEQLNNPTWADNDPRSALGSGHLRAGYCMLNITHAHTQETIYWKCWVKFSSFASCCLVTNNTNKKKGGRIYQLPKFTVHNMVQCQ